MSSIAIPRSGPVGGTDRPTRRFQALPPQLRLVVPPTQDTESGVRVADASSTRAWRRFAVVCGVVVLVAALAVASVVRDMAANAFAAQTDGYVMVEPGRSLWSVAVETAPTGMDVSDYFAALVAVNGGEQHADGWKVVHLPRHP